MNKLKLFLQSLSLENGSGIPRENLGNGSVKFLTVFAAFFMLFTLGIGNAWGDPVVLFHETFGNNSNSARAWSDDYSVKSGVSAVYSGITGYTVSNAKQGKNTTGSTASGLNQSTSGTDAYIIIGPLAVDNYESLGVTYQWKAGSTKGTYTTSLYYATSSTGSYTEVSGTGTGATGFVERSYNLPEAAQVSTLYLKIVWNTSNTQGIIDEVELTGTASGGTAQPTCSEGPLDAPEVTAVAGDKTVTLSWETDANATGYQLKWNGGDWADASSPVEKSNLTNGTAYTYQVKAIGNGTNYCDSDPTTEASATPNATRTITYYDKDGQHTTTLTDGTNIATALTALYGVGGPTSCDAENYAYFVGWKDGDISGIATSVTLLSTEVVNEANAAKSFYAVWADAEPSAGGWVKATSISAGDVVLLVCDAAKMELSSISTTSTKYGIGTAYTTVPAGSMQLTVVAGFDENTYAFQNGSNYLYWNSGNSLATNTTLNANTSWSVEFDESGNAFIKNAADNTRQIWWNTSSPRFACYTDKTLESTGYSITHLYKETSATSANYITTCCTPLSITLAGSGNVSVDETLIGTFSADKTQACEGETVTLSSVVVDENYHFASWSVNDGEIVVDNQNKFTMPSSAVIISATFVENTVPAEIALAENEHATITASVNDESVTSALPGVTVTLAYSDLADGYAFYGWTVTASGAAVTVNDDGEFVMPNSAVTVEADIRQMVTVTFHNGSNEAYDTKQTYVGGTIELADAPATSFDEENFPNFVGWTTSNDGMVTNVPTLVDGTETITTNADYYAVFSDAPVLSTNYKKITSTSELTNGNYLIVAYASNMYFAMQNAVQSSYYVAGTQVSPSENVVANPDATNIFVITTDADEQGGITIYSDESETYIGMIYTSNHYNLKPEETSAHYFSYAVSDGAWTITSKTYTSSSIQFNYYKSQTPEFCGEGSYANPIYLFKQQFVATKWTTRAVEYVTVTYHANAGNEVIDGVPNQITVEKGNNTIDLTATLTRQGYDFVGWNTNNQAEAALESLTNVTTNTDLYAVWSALQTYTINFSVNGDLDNNLKQENALQGDAVSFPTASQVTVPAGTNKVFVGWIGAANYVDAENTPFVTSATVSADKTYYAVFADLVTEGSYEKLTSTTGLAAGDKLVITNGSTAGMKAYAGSGNNCGEATITIEEDNITSLGEGVNIAAELTLGGETGAWTLYDGTYYLYDAGTTDNNYLKGTQSPDNLDYLWEISIEDNVTKVKSHTNTKKPDLQYNSSSHIFSCYKNSQTNVTLFKKAANVYSDYVTTIAPLDHIKLSGDFPTTYKVGSMLDLDDMVVTAYYGVDETSAPNKVVTNYAVSLTEALTTENTQFVVTYTEGTIEKTASQDINVYELTSIDVAAAEGQTITTTYSDGQSFDKTKIVVTATWGPAEAQDKIVEAIDADDYTVTPDPLVYGTTTEVVIRYQNVDATPITVTVNDRDNYVITWNVAGTTTTTKYYVDDNALVLKAAPEVPEGFEDGFEFMGWTSDETINNDGTEITYAKNGDQLTGATTFRAVFAKGETTNGYKLSSTAPADGETIIISRLVESTYYALKSDVSTGALTINDGMVLNPADAVLWDIEAVANSTGFYLYPTGQTSTSLHMNSTALKVAAEHTNGIIKFTANNNSFMAIRDDEQRWIVTSGINGLGCSDNSDNAAELYIFKPYSLTNHSNYRFAPSTVVAPSIELAEGTYYGAQTVTITQEDNKPIYYTRNGGELTLYDNGILLNDNEEVTIVAKAYDSGSNDYSAPVTATYTIVATIAAPMLPDACSFIESKTVAISHPLSETEEFALLYSFDGVDYTAYTEPLVITETKTVYAKATYHNLVAEASPVTYTKTAGTAYDKLTSADQLVVGMQFLIACGTNVAGKPNSITAQTYLKAVGVTTTEDKAFVADEDVQVFTLEGETGAWAFGIGNGKYLIPSGGDVKVSDTKTGAWSIAIASGTPTITCVDNNSNNNTLKYNSGANPTRFKTYNTGQTALTALYYQPYETAYTLTFDVDGTDNDKSVQIVTGFEYTITNNVFGEAPVGYESTNKWTDGKKQYSVGSKIVMNGNKTLTPCWKVVLNPDPEVPNVLDGNDIANNDLIVEHGETVTLSLTEQSPTMGVIRVTKGKVIIDNANPNPSANPVTLTSDSIDIDKNGVVEVKTAVTAPYFRFCAAPGQTSEAGELFGSNNISVDGDIYLDVQLDPTAVDASEWYGISAPFDVNIADGFFTTDGTQLVSNYHFQLWIYDPQKYSNGGRSWTRCTTGVMEANKAYLIGFDPSRFTTVPNVIRLKYAGTQLPSTVESLGIQQYSNGYGWNGVANPNFFNVNVNRPIQIFDNHSHNFLPATLDETGYNFVATMPLFCKATGVADETITFTEATHGATYEYSAAPTRTTGERYSFRIQIRKPNSPYYDNQMYVRASEDALATFEDGKDMETLNETCSGSAAIMWTNAYGKHLAIEDAPLQNNQAIYNLTIMTPAAGTYVLRQANEVQGADLYVTYEGAIVWNLSLGDYEMDLVRGTTTGYGLLLVAQPNQMPTGVENGELLNGENGVQKILLNGNLYILRDGHLYDAVGKQAR